MNIIKLNRLTAREGAIVEYYGANTPEPQTGIIKNGEIVWDNDSEPTPINDSAQSIQITADCYI
jgi:hypothetical protein